MPQRCGLTERHTSANGNIGRGLPQSLAQILHIKKRHHRSCCACVCPSAPCLSTAARCRAAYSRVSRRLLGDDGVHTLSRCSARRGQSVYCVRRTTTLLCHRWRTSTLCVHQMSHQLRTRVCGGAHCAARRRLLQESTCERSRVDSRGTQYRGRADSIYERPASNVNLNLI